MSRYKLKIIKSKNEQLMDLQVSNNLDHLVGFAHGWLSAYLVLQSSIDLIKFEYYEFDELMEMDEKIKFLPKKE